MKKRQEIRRKIQLNQRVLLKRLPVYILLGLTGVALWFTYLFTINGVKSYGAITADTTQSNLLNVTINRDFPVQSLQNDLVPFLICFTHEELRHTDQGGKVISRDGADIHFFGFDKSPLVYEIERYEPFTGRVWAWVHLNHELAKQGKIFIGYGEASEEMLTGFGYPYFSVWHLNGGFQSSAAYPLAGEYRMIKDGEGKICGAKEFNASSQASISFDRPFSFPTHGNIQVSAWFKPNTTGDVQYLFTDKNNKGGISLFIDRNNRPAFELYKGSKKQSVKGSTPISAGVWYKFTAGIDTIKQQLYIYVNNQLVGVSQTNWSYQNGGRLVIGAVSERCHSFLDGTLDELRVSSLGNDSLLIGSQFLCENNPQYLLGSSALVSEKKEGAKISDLEAEAKNEYVAVRWFSENEHLAEYYMLERASGKDSFRTIQTCEVRSNSGTGGQNYVLLDKEPLQGESVYRISTFGRAGKQTPELTAKVFFSNSGNPISIRQVSPNPFKSRFDVSFSTQTKEAVQISLTSMSGETVHKSAFTPEETGDQLFHFNGSDKLSPGVYFLNLRQSDYQRTLKLVKRG